MKFDELIQKHSSILSEADGQPAATTGTQTPAGTTTTQAAPAAETPEEKIANAFSLLAQPQYKAKAMQILNTALSTPTGKTAAEVLKSLTWDSATGQWKPAAQNTTQQPPAQGQQSAAQQPVNPKP